MQNIWVWNTCTRGIRSLRSAKLHLKNTQPQIKDEARDEGEPWGIANI